MKVLNRFPIREIENKPLRAFLEINDVLVVAVYFFFPHLGNRPKCRPVVEACSF
jgi:hypothetical protein